MVDYAPVTPPGELDETYASSFILLCESVTSSTITSQEDKATATGNVHMYRTFGEI